MDGCLVGSGLLLGAHATAGPLGVPRLPGLASLRREVSAGEGFDVVVPAGIEQHRVVHVPGLLLPGIEEDFLVGVVGMQRGDHALNGIVEEHRAHAGAHVGFEGGGIAEERLELADRLALVVEDGPSAADPARVYVLVRQFRPPVCADNDSPLRIALRTASRLRPHLLLDLAPEAVGVGQAQLDPGLLPGGQIGRMRLACHGQHGGRLRLGIVARAMVCEEII